MIRIWNSPKTPYKPHTIHPPKPAELLLQIPELQEKKKPSSPKSRAGNEEGDAMKAYPKAFSFFFFS